MCGSISFESCSCRVRIIIEFVPTEEQHADMLTKALGGAKLEKHRTFLMNLP